MGGNSGIGLATSKRFLAKGAHLVITGRRAKELNEAAALIGKNVMTVALINILGGRTGVVDEAPAERGLSRRISLWIPYFATAATIIANSELILTLPSRRAAALAACPWGFAPL